MYVCVCGQFVVVLVHLQPQVVEDFQPPQDGARISCHFLEKSVRRDPQNAAVGILP